ncbi:toprim domain-containing protein [Proteocatella sphenisci]|uniref:toprim domain-containing protein n=1 Tax=Proteocatella sphenisci TaxID=181070 RepID=UPI002FE5DA7F
MKNLNKKNVKKYDNTSITSLKGADRVRLRPGVIFGSDGIEGCSHSMFEILSNSIDEAREGFGKEILVIRHLDKAITVRDEGRGMPLDYNPVENRYNFELIFEELYAGGKYETDGNYEYSLGLNGLGACATQYASEYMDVEVARDGYIYNIHFEKGYNVGGLLKKETKNSKTYTQIKFRPDLEVFTDIDIPLDYYKDTLKKQAVTNKGLKFTLIDEESDSQFEYYYENGIVDYLKEVTSDDNLIENQFLELETRGRDREDKPEYKLKAEVGFTFSKTDRLMEYYHNSSYLEHGGSPDKAVKSAFVSVIDQYIKNNNKYQKNEKKISFIDIQESLIIIINSFSTITSYENQTKKAINNKFIQEAITEFLKEKINIYFIENPEDAEKIVNQVLINKRSRENAEKARQALKGKLSGSMDALNRVKKFVDCRTKDLNRRELYIVEGDSALGSCKLGRDAEFQAIIPIRGKILNCLKADYGKIFKSDIIIDIIKVIGTGIEINSKLAKDFVQFDLNNLKWDKIIICTDADVDGFQIRTLLLTMFYILTPTLIEEGRIFIAESPLYEINTKRNSYFAYSDKEKNKILEKIKSDYTLQRSKGLGENDPEMMWKTTMNPESRRLIKITTSDAQETKETFEFLLGDDLKTRKEYIEEFGEMYISQIDEL